MSGYREPGRDIDVTEIERAKIHEAAETKRKLIEEREETRRVKAKTHGPVVPVVVGLVLLSAIAGGTCVGYRRVEAKDPHRFPACTESAEIVTSNTPPRACSGGRVTAETLPNGNALIRCRCDAASAEHDGGVK